MESKNAFFKSMALGVVSGLIVPPGLSFKQAVSMVPEAQAQSAATVAAMTLPAVAQMAANVKQPTVTMPNINTLQNCDNQLFIENTLKATAESAIQTKGKDKAWLPKSKNAYSKDPNQVAFEKMLGSAASDANKDYCNGPTEVVPAPSSLACEQIVGPGGKALDLTPYKAQIALMGLTGTCRTQSVKDLEVVMSCMNQKATLIKQQIGNATQQINSYLQNLRTQARQATEAIQTGYEQRQKFAEILGVALPAQKMGEPPAAIDDATFEKSEMVQRQRQLESLLMTTANSNGQAQASLSDKVSYYEELMTRTPDLDDQLAKRSESLLEAEVLTCLKTQPQGYATADDQRAGSALSAIDLLAAWSAQSAAVYTSNGQVTGVKNRQEGAQAVKTKQGEMNLTFAQIFNGVPTSQTPAAGQQGAASGPDYNVINTQSLIQDIMPGNGQAAQTAGVSANGDRYIPVGLNTILSRAEQSLSGVKVLTVSGSNRTATASAYDKFKGFYSKCLDFSKQRVSRATTQAKRNLNTFKVSEQRKFENEMRGYSSLWNQIASRVTKNNEQLDGVLGKSALKECTTPGSGNAMSANQVNCLRGVQSSFQMLLKGPFKNAMTYTASGKGKIPNAAITCGAPGGLEDCTTKLKNAVTNKGTEIRDAQTGMSQAITQANQYVDQMTQAASTQLRPMIDKLQEYMTQMGNKLAGMGVDSNLKFSYVKGAEKKPDQYGIYQGPASIMQWIGDGMIDLDKDPFGAVQKSLAQASRKAGELVTKAKKEDVEFKKRVETCFADSARAAIGKLNTQFQPECAQFQEFCGGNSIDNGLLDALAKITGTSISYDLNVSKTTLETGVNNFCAQNKLQKSKDQQDLEAKNEALKGCEKQDHCDSGPLRSEIAILNAKIKAAGSGELRKLVGQDPDVSLCANTRDQFKMYADQIKSLQDEKSKAIIGN